MTTQVAHGRLDLAKELCKALNVDTETDLVKEVTISITADGWMTVTTLKYLPESNLKELVTLIDRYNLHKFKEEDNA